MGGFKVNLSVKVKETQLRVAFSESSIFLLIISILSAILTPLQMGWSGFWFGVLMTIICGISYFIVNRNEVHRFSNSSFNPYILIYRALMITTSIVIASTYHLCGISIEPLKLCCLIALGIVINYCIYTWFKSKALRLDLLESISVRGIVIPLAILLGIGILLWLVEKNSLIASILTITTLLLIGSTFLYQTILHHDIELKRCLCIFGFSLFSIIVLVALVVITESDWLDIGFNFNNDKKNKQKVS